MGPRAAPKSCYTIGYSNMLAKKFWDLKAIHLKVAEVEKHWVTVIILCLQCYGKLFCSFQKRNETAPNFGKLVESLLYVCPNWGVF